MLTTKQIRAMQPTWHHYTLQLTPSEVAALEWLNGRYSWVELLYAAERDSETPGLITLTESEAWAWCEDVQEDDSLFPGVGSDLRCKLLKFFDEVV